VLVRSSISSQVRCESGDAPFGQVYAGFYDAAYANKDYERECDLLERAFGRYGAGPISALLDLGCGSGGHLLPLAKRGYDVVGVDSSPSMLGAASDKIAESGLAIGLHEGDVRTVQLERTFDAALLMFAVLGYQTSNDDVLATLRNARAHLRPGGLLCFDVWYGPAVLTVKPEERRRTVSTPSGSVERHASAALDVRQHLCTISYRFERYGTPGAVAAEEHRVRFFFPMELDLFLRDADLQLLSLTRFGSLEKEPDAETWNVLVIARAR
jgi:SAM-dependent methyltransferase